jgi:hypothetical protein
MATQTIEFRAATGLTLSVELFAIGSDTIVATASATEQTNRTGTYSVAFTDVAAGEYQLIAFSSTTPVASWLVNLKLITSTFQVYDRSNAATPNFTLGVGTTNPATSTTRLNVFLNETITQAIVVYLPNSTTPVDLSGLSLELVIETLRREKLAVITDLTISGDDNNIVTFTYPLVATDNLTVKQWSLRDDADPFRVYMNGTLHVLLAAVND